MTLKKFGCSKSENFDDCWMLKSFDLGKINLLVAKNSTGKTRTIRAITQLSQLIIGKGTSVPAHYLAEFFDGSNSYQYELNIESKMVITERLAINGIDRILRNKMGKGDIFAENIGKNIAFQLPRDNLAVLKRDILRHPYLEQIFGWANNVHCYSFGSSMKQEYGERIDAPDSIIDGNSDNTVEVFIVGNLEFNNKYKEVVLSSMHRIGYDLTDVDAERWTHLTKRIGPEYYSLFVVEKEGNITINQSDMSQGMFRALSIIIHITYHVLMKTTGTIIIDDIGEGLDFDRSSKLIKLLIELAEQNDNIQLIMSTNDRFVMNAVPLQYWQVIQRNGGQCKVFNYRNSKEKFDEFEYMGLNNFDFLATDYLNSKWEKI